jgi:hypothetical protein
MPQTTIFSFHPRHIGFANDVVFISNELAINLVSITHPKITLPKGYLIPEKLKGFGTMVTDGPT